MSDGPGQPGENRGQRSGLVGCDETSPCPRSPAAPSCSGRANEGRQAVKTTTRTTMTFRCACGQNARIVTDAPNQPEWALVGGWTVNTSGGLDTCPDCIARWRAEASTPPVASSPVGGEQHG